VIGESMRWATMAAMLLVCIMVATWVYYDGV